MEIAQGIPTRDVGIVGYLHEDFTGGETYFGRQGATGQWWFSQRIIPTHTSPYLYNRESNMP